MPLTDRFLTTEVLSLTALALASAAVVLTGIHWVWAARQHRRFRAVLGGAPPENLEEMLLAAGARLEELERRLADGRRRLDALERQAPGYVQHVGVVRFQAFPEVGSDLSFAVALLDGNGNGVVLSSLYGRTESRIFAKPVHQGTSNYPLTEEERLAIARALGREGRG
ncbi:MAG: DUF4446 family protein [Firmicutes bacterium]|nr:DUF4446 family protein [Bacillota bacterium]